MAEAAPARFMRSSAWVLMKVCGEPVSRRATQPSCTATGSLCILILVVEEESSIVITSNKTRSLLGEHGGMLIGVGSRHHSKNVAAVVRWHVW